MGILIINLSTFLSMLKCPNAQMEAEIEQFKAESSQQEKNNNSRLRDIYKQQKKTESQAEDYEQQTSVISKILDDVKAGIEIIISIAVRYGSIWYSLGKQRNLLCFSEVLN